MEEKHELTESRSFVICFSGRRCFIRHNGFHLTMTFRRVVNHYRNGLVDGRVSSHKTELSRPPDRAPHLNSDARWCRLQVSPLPDEDTYCSSEDWIRIVAD